MKDGHNGWQKNLQQFWAKIHEFIETNINVVGKNSNE